jgi:hypothetical protein
MEKEATLNNKEQKRLLVLNEVMAGRLTGQEADHLNARWTPMTRTGPEAT